MAPNHEELLAGIRRLAVSVGEDVSVETLTAAKDFLPRLAKQKEEEREALEAEAAKFPPQILAVTEVASAARSLLHAAEDAHNRLVAEHRQANGKTISDLRQRLSMARAERGRIQESHFPFKSFSEAQAKAKGPSPLATRWQELEEEVIPNLESELAALENVTF